MLAFFALKFTMNSVIYSMECGDLNTLAASQSWPAMPRVELRAA